MIIRGCRFGLGPSDHRFRSRLHSDGSAIAGTLTPARVEELASSLPDRILSDPGWDQDATEAAPDDTFAPIAPADWVVPCSTADIVELTRMIVPGFVDYSWPLCGNGDVVGADVVPDAAAFEQWTFSDEMAVPAGPGAEAVVEDVSMSSGRCTPPSESSLNASGEGVSGDDVNVSPHEPERTSRSSDDIATARAENPSTATQHRIVPSDGPVSELCGWDTLVSLIDLLRFCRNACIDQVAPLGLLTPAQRYRLISQTSDQIAWLRLFRAGHILELWRATDEGTTIQMDPARCSMTALPGTSSGPGNPRSRAAGAMLDDHLKSMFPDLNPAGREYTRRRRNFQHMRRHGRNLNMFVQTFGIGVLGLLICAQGPHGSGGFSDAA